MGSKVLIVPLFFLEVITLNASTIEDTNGSNSTGLISMYNINTKTNQPQVSSNGGGLFYNSQNIKLKVERSTDAVKTAAIIKVNPLHNSLYVKFGVNYLNQNIYNYDSTTESVSQHSGALGVGYMLNNDLDLELGSSVTEVIGNKTNLQNEIANQTIKNTYCQLAQRVEIPIGTIDVSVNGNQLYQNLSTKEQNYGSRFNYYPDDNIKVGYSYSNSQNNVSTGYSINYGYFTTEYANYISQDTYSVTVGFKAKFMDITDFSSYIIPVKVKPPLIRSHRFDDMVLYDNMNIYI
ncbi:MAG: hypothetical protein PHQ22_05530 [Sulfuricurvum sp.]|nr:hypothetical protein [Sulfuricurvum sp.]MDD5386636.1 hypothetical protein [Sulfuricurvum sp.]